MPKITSRSLTPEAINFMQPRKVDGGWLYVCDGLPTLMGCGDEIIVTRQYKRTGIKSSGWLVCNGIDEHGKDEPEIGLTFCPSCALVVLGS